MLFNGMALAIFLIMRITNEMTYRMLASNIAINKEAAYKTQQQITSGKKVNRPSDDPGAFETIGRLHTDNSHALQYARNAEHAENSLLNIDRILQDMVNIFHRASEIAITGGDSTTQAHEAMGEEVNQLLESLVALANSSDGGRYIFSGLRTDTESYSASRNGDGMITGITYQGSDKVRQVEIGRGTYVPANIPGTDITATDAVFQTSEVDLFNSLIQLRDRLLADENIVSTETFVADATDILTVQNVYTTGSRVEVSSDGTLPPGLNANTTYYAIKISDTEIKLAASLADAKIGTPIVDITGTGSGTHTIKQKTLEELDAGLDHVINTLSIVGAREERIHIQQDILIQHEVNLQEMLEQEESIDIAKAMIELSKRQSAYEAALRAASGVLNQSSLIDFI